MKFNRKPIQMADVQRTKVVVEGIVQKSIIDGKVMRRQMGRRLAYGTGGTRALRG